MVRYRIGNVGLMAACVAATLGACGRLVDPVEVTNLSIDLVFPGESAVVRGKPAQADTAGAVTRMDLVVTTRDGRDIFRNPFSKTEHGWEIEASLAPATGLTVQVKAWHYDALIYAGVDTGVTVEAGTVTTAIVVLESYRPHGQLALTRDGSSPFAVFADPRGSTDRVSRREDLRVRYDWHDDGSWDTEYLSLIPQLRCYPGQGTYSVRAAVRNAAGLITEVTGEILLLQQAPPLSPSLSINPSEGEPGAFFFADARPSLTGLSDADSVRFRWDWNGDEAWDTPWQNLPLAQVQLIEPGTYRVRMEMTANHQRQASAEAQVVVRSASVAPLVARLAVSPLVANVGESVRLDARGTSSGAGESPLRFRWDWDGDGRWDTAWGPENAVSVTYQAPGQRRVVVEVMDARGDSAAASGEVVVNSGQRLAPGQEVIVDNVPMRYVPSGAFPMGERSMTADEFPVHEASVKGFLMDTYEVTNAEYQRFVTVTGHRAPPHWIGGHYPAGQSDLPVVNVSWSDAAAYAAWRDVRLPTEEEWEYAARGADGRVFPWGDQMEPNRANYGQNPIGPVGRRPAGASPFGMQDMAGNVWEWTVGLYRPYPGFSDYILVHPSTGGQFDETRYLISANPFTLERLSHRVARGGGVGIESGTNGVELRSSNREPLPPETRDRYVGFRCVKDIE